MVRDTLSRVPVIAPPASVTLRPYVEGDAAAWVAVHRLADIHDSFDVDRFAAEFGEDRTALAQRQIFAVDQRRGEVGTITVWTAEEGVDPSYGRLHWLAVIPEAQRRGVGAALVSGALERMRALGYAHAYLTTSSARTTALRLYQRLGFRVVRIDTFYRRFADVQDGRATSG